MRTLTFFQSLVELKFDKCMEGSERTQTMLNYNLSVYIKASASIIYQTLFKAWPLFACFNAYSWKPPKLSSNLPGIGILMLCIASQPFLNNWGVNRVSWTGRPYMGPANQQATLCRWRLLQYKYKDREKWNTTHNHKHKSYTFLNTITSKGPVKILEVLQISYHRYIRQIYLITHILGKYIKYILDKPCHLEKNATFVWSFSHSSWLIFCPFNRQLIPSDPNLTPLRIPR